jgi:hypothetical protein
MEKIKASAREVMEAIQLKRKGDDVMNTYIVGDLVLFDEVSLGRKNAKLTPRYSGPYIVSLVYKSDITCSHIVTGKSRVLHMENIKPYFGSKEDAYKAALVDDDQHVIDAILDYSGDTEKRSEMEFLVLFEDQEKVWIQYNMDLCSSMPFEVFCRSLRELEPLLYTVKEWRMISSLQNSRGIINVVPGQECFVTLRAWGSDYYHFTGLPMGLQYMVLCTYTKWTDKKKKKIDMHCKFFKQSFDWNATAVRLYGMNFALTDGMVLVTDDLKGRYPAI